MKRILFTLLIIAVINPVLYAQMFSVDDEGERSRNNPFAPYIRFGWSPVDFDYSSEVIGVAPDPRFNNDVRTNDYTMNPNALHLSFETPNIRGELNIANQLTGLDDASFVRAGLVLNNTFFLVRKPSFVFALPLQLHSTVINARKDDINDDFSQTTLAGGLGTFFQFRNIERFDITTEFVPSYGVTSTAGGFFAGSAVGLDGKARLNLYNVFFGRNLSLGFNYRFNSLNIETDDFDEEVDLNQLIFSVGVSL